MPATKNHSATTATMGVRYLVPNQAWCVIWHDQPIAIRDRLFFDDLRVLAAHLDDLGLHLLDDGTIQRWCPVGRLLTGYEPYLAFLAICPNHASEDSQFCAEHAHHRR